DGDSIGAQIGLFALIKALRKGKNTKILMIDHSPVPKRYSFLVGSQDIITFEDWEKLAKKPSFDLGVVCDGGVERTGDVQVLFKNILNLALVDHHAFGSGLKYQANILDLTSSSSCELVCHLFELAKIPITARLAEALYIGIVFDTGFFKHSITTPRTHYVASNLVATGIDFSKISDIAILDRSWEAQLLLKTMMMNMERSASGRVISSHWSADELKEIGPKDGDQEGMINQLYYTEGCDVVALFVEKENKKEVKVSFRSKGFNVAEFARSLTEHGGGHIRAAGCTLQGGLAQVKPVVLERLAAALGSSDSQPQKKTSSG
ncbi:MAG: exopolyphosphatase, partial [Bacteriovoracaceae bacterium]|nr:exopolyphosphatase [Bacteriovoracaceae bacterium]